MDKKHIIILILFLLGIKSAYLTFSIIKDGSNGNLIEQYVGIAKKNDAYWYQKITLNGYPEIKTKRDLGYAEGVDFKQSEWAFFPFYPMLNSFTIRILNINYDTSSLIWSFVFSILSMFGIYWFGNIFFKDNSKALFATLLMFGFPFSFYFSMFYTEAVFLTIVIFGFLCIHYKKYLCLSILLIPLTLIRPNGIVVLLPLYLYYLEQNGILRNFNVKWNKLFAKKNLLRSLYFITSPLAFILYGIYQYKMTGYFFAFSIAQAGWYRKLMFPLLSFFRRGDLATQFNSVYTIIVILYAIWIRKKLPFSLNIFVLVSLLLPLCSGSATSMTRFISVIFPLFFALTLSIYKLKRKYLILFIIISLHFVSFYSWLIHQPISY